MHASLELELCFTIINSCKHSKNLTCYAECKPPIVVYICTIYLQVYLKGINFVIANQNYV